MQQLVPLLLCTCSNKMSVSSGAYSPQSDTAASGHSKASSGGLQPRVPQLRNQRPFVRSQLPRAIKSAGSVGSRAPSVASHSEDAGSLTSAAFSRGEPGDGSEAASVTVASARRSPGQSDSSGAFHREDAASLNSSDLSRGASSSISSFDRFSDILPGASRDLFRVLAGLRSCDFM
jgi:hypothetical protein